MPDVGAQNKENDECVRVRAREPGGRGYLKNNWHLL